MRPIPTVLPMVALVCFVAPSAAHGGDAYKDQIYGYSVTKDVVYGQAPTPSGTIDLLCDVYQPVDIGQGPVPENRPAVVIQDGGAWTSGSKDNSRVVVPTRFMTQHGFTVIVTDYRYWEAGYYLGGFTGDTEFGSRPYSGLDFPFYLYVFPGEEVIKAGIEDHAVAMAWVRDNAASLGIDPNRIAAAGGSSGGINVLCCQYNSTPVPARYRAQAVMGLVATMYDNEDRINAGAPPAFMLNNTLDPVIWYQPDIPDFIDRLAGLGIYFELWHQEAEVNHGFDYNEIIDGVPIMKRMTNYFCYHLADGPLQVGYTLGLTASPPGSGTISADPPPRGDGTYAAGTVVTLTADPAEGSLFSSWSGHASGSTNPVAVTMDGHKNVTASFAEGQTLTLTVVNDTWGTVTVEPNLPLYLPGTEVTLAADPIEEKAFGSWTIYDPNYPGDANYATVDANLTTRVVMDAHMQVEAKFKCGSGMSEAMPLLAVGLAVVGLVSRGARRRR